MNIYTRVGDDGTTALRDGERIAKDSLVIELNGAIDEAQAALGVARAETAPGEPLDEALIAIERDLWIVMAEIANPNPKRETDASMTVSPEMVVALEDQIDRFLGEVGMPKSFAVPGETRLSAALDFARTVVRRAERLAVTYNRAGEVVAYLNRLSDLCWALARYSEGEHLVNKRGSAERPGRTPRSIRVEH